MDDYSDNERGRNADFTLAVLALALMPSRMNRTTDNPMSNSKNDATAM